VTAGKDRHLKTKNMIEYRLSFQESGIEVVRYTIVDSRDMRGNHRFAIAEDKICVFRIKKLKKTTKTLS